MNIITRTYDDAEWQLVPKQPDQGMQLKGVEAVRMDTTVLNRIWTANKVYRDMLAAAPQPPDAQSGPATNRTAPFANCQFRECDLPGQCKGEGRCHHPVAQSGPVGALTDAEKAEAIELSARFKEVTWAYVPDAAFNRMAFLLSRAAVQEVEILPGWRFEYREGIYDIFTPEATLTCIPDGSAVSVEDASGSPSENRILAKIAAAIHAARTGPSA
jgi:hypothetical protein